MPGTPASSRRIHSSQHTTAQLTARQVTVLRLAARGLSGKQIARHLGISARTVQGHFRDMRQRTGVRSHGELIAYAAAAGLLAPGRPAAAPGGRSGPPASAARRQPPARRPQPASGMMTGAPLGSATAARDETQPTRSGTRDETPAGTSRCQVCGAPLAATRTGRPRRYCSRACQARAYRARQQAASPRAEQQRYSQEP